MMHQETTRETIAEILETIAKDGLDDPRDLDVALDAIESCFSVIDEEMIERAAKALYKAYEETTDTHVDLVFDYHNESDKEVKAIWEETVRDMRKWSKLALEAAFKTV